MGLFRRNITSFTDEQLMGLLGGSRKNEALTELHTRYGKKALGYFIKMFRGDIERSHDFVQELFIRIMEKHHLFDQEKKFCTWMFTVASNMCRTYFRKPAYKGTEVGTFELQKIMQWNDDLVDIETFRQVLREAIDCLEPHHRMPFVLRYMEERSVKEIAEIMDISEGTVKSRLFYGTKKIAISLKEFNPVNEGMLFKMN